MSLRRAFNCTTLVVLALALQAPAALAQERASLRGMVVDQFGAAIIGAIVTLTDSSRSQRTSVSNEQGGYAFGGLAAGRYTVHASAKGFATSDDAEVQVRPDYRQPLNITLKVRTLETQVRVVAETPLSTDPTNNANQLVLSGKDLEALPDDPEELAAALQALAGPSAGPAGGQIFIDGFSGGRIPPKESIREIRINQNPFSAEYDRPGFGRVEIFTKPGADKLRGQGFFTFNDESLNSRNPFAPQRAPHQLRNFGGNLSGPVVARKASFFVDFERRYIDDNAVVNAIVLDSALNPTPFTEVRAVPQRSITISPRFDYQLNATNTLVARYSFTHSTAHNVNVGDFSLPSRAVDIENSDQSWQMTETAVLGSKVLNETRFQYLRTRRNRIGLDNAPTIIVADAFTGGGSGLGHSFTNDDRWELQNNTSWTMIHHSLTVGARLRGVRVRDVSRANFNGTFFFASLQQYKQVLLGTPGAFPSQFSVVGPDPEANVKQGDFGGFVQDEWRLRPNLTLSGGLRYENQSNISSNLNIAPRIGFAWSPDAGKARQPKTVVRAGFGIFYDRFNENLTLTANRFDGIREKQFILRAPTFFPTVPSIEALQTLAPQTITIRRVAQDLEAPYTLQTAVSVERQILHQITLSVTYVNSRGLHMLRSRNVNAPLPGTFNPFLPGSGVRPNGNTGNVYLYESSGVFNQNQLVVTANNRFSRKLTIFGRYTLSRTRSNTDGANTFPVNSYDLSGEYGRAAQDIHHSFFLGGSIAAPWGLRLNPLIFAFSGRPFNITTGLDTNGDLQFNERPSFASDLTRPSVISTPFGAFDLNPVPGEQVISRNYGTSPGYLSFNLQLSRTWAFGTVNRRNTIAATGRNPTAGGSSKPSTNPSETSGRGSKGSSGGLTMGQLMGGGNSPAEKRYSLTFSVRAGNLFNQTNPGPIIGNLLSPFFGRANSLAGSFGGFSLGGPSAAANRRIDLTVRLGF